MKKLGEFRGRLKRMHKGYFRLCIAVNLLAVPLIAGCIAASQKDSEDPDKKAKVFFGALLGLAICGSMVYWLFVRFVLWIYDGFAAEKQK